MNTQIPMPTRRRLKAFVEMYDTTIQDVIDAALNEYMTARGFEGDRRAEE